MNVFAFISRHAKRFQVQYAVAGLSIFASGLALAVYSLEMDWAQVSWAPLLVNAFVGTPVILFTNAVGLIYSGKIVKSRIGFEDAFRISATATSSNILPLPAASAIQSAALAARGSGILQSGAVVLLGNILMLSIICAVVCIVFFESLGSISLIAGSISIVVILWMAFYLRRLAAGQAVLGFFIIRFARIIVMTLRVKLSFLVLGVTISLPQAISIVGVIILGTSATIFPAGLGVSELLAALLSRTVELTPAEAFVAVALNRVVTILVAAAIATMMTYRRYHAHSDGD